MSILREEALCGHPLRDGPCNMDADHRGRHTSVAWRCDGCGKTRRGTVHAWSPDGEYERGLAFCFMCASRQMTYNDVPEWYP